MKYEGEYIQISIFDILEDQNEQIEQKPYDRCDHCNMPRCYGCKYLEDDE